MKIVKVTNRILWQNGDYIAEISDGKIKTTYHNPKVAKITSELMKKDNIKHEFINENTIIQKIEKSEEEILEKIKEELESAIKNKSRFMKLNYIIEEVNNDKKII